MTKTERILVVDGAHEVRESLCTLLDSMDYAVSVYAYAEALFRDDISSCACLVANSRTLGMDALQLQEELVRRNLKLPHIITTEFSDIPLCVRAMAAGAVDFLERPYDPDVLLRSIERVTQVGYQARPTNDEVISAREALATLTSDEQDALARLIAGQTIGTISNELHEPAEAVAVGRARALSKLKCTRLAEVVRITLAARWLN